MLVPGGKFIMGHPNGAIGGMDGVSQRKVQVSTFLIGSTEITVGEFAAFVKATSYETTAELKGGGYYDQYGFLQQKPELNWRCDVNGEPYKSLESSYPVLYVSWLDAIHYCNWRSKVEGFKLVYHVSGETVECNWTSNGYRLPTEAEWEYAAGGGSKHNRWGGTDHTGYVLDYANIKDKDNLDIFEKLAPVGLFAPNEFGLCDMSGNVEEWCWDYYKYYPDDTTALTFAPHGPTKIDTSNLTPMSYTITIRTSDYQIEEKKLKFTSGTRIVKGGNWRSPQKMARLYARKRHYQLILNNLIGFRIARNEK
jgi:formylglycine-generating enzyme required for sulfatase activity